MLYAMLAACATLMKHRNFAAAHGRAIRAHPPNVSAKWGRSGRGLPFQREACVPNADARPGLALQDALGAHLPHLSQSLVRGLARP